MTINYTTLLGLAQPVTGTEANTWGTAVNDEITALLDTAVAGTTTLSSDADVTLTTTAGAANTSRQAVILWTASGSTTRNITAPAQSKTYMVINATGSTQSIVLRGAGPTTGITVVAGEKCVAAWNGSDFVKIASSVADGVTTITFGSTGLTPSTATSGAVTVAGTLANTNGGTGQSSAFTQYGITYASTTTVLATTAAGTTTTVLHGNAAGAPTFGAVSLTADVSGILGAANGGTGVANNAAMTVTGSGNFAYTRTLTGTTNVTLPTTGTLATLAGTETFTNKTLTTPVISSISNTGTLTLPTSTDTLVGRATTDTLTNKTLTNPTVTNYVETVVAIGTVTTTNTLSLTNGTVQTATLTASTACTFTMPTATAGKSFILLLKQAAATGNGTATFTGVKFGTAGAPTITATAGKMDILTFVADGTNWYGSAAQGYTP